MLLDLKTTHTSGDQLTSLLRMEQQWNFLTMSIIFYVTQSSMNNIVKSDANIRNLPSTGGDISNTTLNGSWISKAAPWCMATGSLACLNHHELCHQETHSKSSSWRDHWRALLMQIGELQIEELPFTKIWGFMPPRTSVTEEQHKETPMTLEEAGLCLLLIHLCKIPNRHQYPKMVWQWHLVQCHCGFWAMLVQQRTSWRAQLGSPMWWWQLWVSQWGNMIDYNCKIVSVPNMHQVDLPPPKLPSTPPMEQTRAPAANVPEQKEDTALFWNSTRGWWRCRHFANSQCATVWSARDAISWQRGGPVTSLVHQALHGPPNPEQTPGDFSGDVFDTLNPVDPSAAVLPLEQLVAHTFLP